MLLEETNRRKLKEMEAKYPKSIPASRSHMRAKIGETQNCFQLLQIRSNFIISAAQLFICSMVCSKETLNARVNRLNSVQTGEMSIPTEGRNRKNSLRAHRNVGKTNQFFF